MDGGRGRESSAKGSPGGAFVRTCPARPFAGALARATSRREWQPAGVDERATSPRPSRAERGRHSALVARVAGSLPARVLRRMIEIAGYDRAVALAAQAFMSLLPMLLVLGALLPADARGPAGWCRGLRLRPERIGRSRADRRRRSRPWGADPGATAHRRERGAAARVRARVRPDPAAHPPGGLGPARPGHSRLRVRHHRRRGAGDRVRRDRPDRAGAGPGRGRRDPRDPRARPGRDPGVVAGPAAARRRPDRLAGAAAGVGGDRGRAGPRRRGVRDLPAGVRSPRGGALRRGGGRRRVRLVARGARPAAGRRGRRERRTPRPARVPDGR